MPYLANSGTHNPRLCEISSSRPSKGSASAVLAPASEISIRRYGQLGFGGCWSGGVPLPTEGRFFTVGI
jgi:hypothetical protein